MRPFVGHRKKRGLGGMISRCQEHQNPSILDELISEVKAMGPFTAPAYERASKVRECLERQANDGALWFGRDVEYVRKQLRELTGLLELPEDDESEG